jgi:hypothetical protein
MSQEPGRAEIRAGCIGHDLTIVGSGEVVFSEVGRPLESSHDISVRVLASSQGEPFVGAPYLESELPVERDGGAVVCEDAKVQAREPQPVIREVQGGLQQFRAHPFPLPVVAYGHPEVPECLILGCRWRYKERCPTTSPPAQATRENSPSRSSASLSRQGPVEENGSPNVSAIARGPE